MTGSTHHIHDLTVSRGFPDEERERAAGLFWNAFAGKIGPFLRPEDKALAFLSSALSPDFALVARDGRGRMLGLAGFKTEAGALVGGTLRDLAAQYGWLGALWRGLALSLLERRTEPGVLLMDGIFVHPDARGRGAGTALLRAIADHARKSGLHSVRLDVIDTNPRARALYEREGFVAHRTEKLGPLRHLFGFSASTEMRLELG